MFGRVDTNVYRTYMGATEEATGQALPGECQSRREHGSEKANKKVNLVSIKAPRIFESNQNASPAVSRMWVS